MQAIDIDLIATIVLSATLFGAAGAALSLLPWSDEDVARTAGAARRVGTWARYGVGAVARSVNGSPMSASTRPSAA